MQNAFAVPAHQRNENEATAMQTMETTEPLPVCVMLKENAET